MDHILVDRSVGLEAVLVVDDTTLGPPVGGTRTKTYPSFDAARSDARALARAMTLKCALAGLAAGGLKIVVRLPPNLSAAERRRVFASLGRKLAEMDFPMHTAGDFGTTADDLSEMAKHVDGVHLGGRELAGATARGLLRCVEVVASRRDRAVDSLRIVVQGCGVIGAAVARALRAAGARVFVADIDESLAADLAAEIGAEVIEPGGALLRACDIVAPCAIGGVVDVPIAGKLKAWAVVGAANNVLADPTAANVLRSRGVILVPDVIASAGAVVDGVGERVMNLADRTPLIDGLGDVLTRVLDRAERDDVSTREAAHRIALEALRD